MKIAVMTAGGDCPALNAFLKKLVIDGIAKGYEITAFKNGKTGMCKKNPDVEKLELKDVNNGIELLGGTFIGSCKRDSKKVLQAGKIGIKFSAIDENENIVDFVPYFKKAIAKMKPDVLVISGGDSSINIFYHCCKMINLPLIVVPKTIDNNVPLTDLCLGFNSAVDMQRILIDNINNTARSHRQWMIFQTMGGGTGELALTSGITAGVDIIIIPEIQFDIKNIIKRIEADKKNGKEFGVIIIAEGVKPSSKKYSSFAEELKNVLEKQKISTRLTVAGNYIRGCNPNATDRLLGTLFGARAIEMICAKRFNKMIAFNNNNIEEIDIENVITAPADKVSKNHNTFEFAQKLGIYVGEKFL